MLSSTAVTTAAITTAAITAAGTSITQAARDGREGGDQIGTQGAENADDSNGDEGCDQAVFDGGSAIVVFQKVVDSPHETFLYSYEHGSKRMA
jgi:hypothetical protein